MKKRVLASLLISAVMFMFAACDRDNYPGLPPRERDRSETTTEDPAVPPTEIPTLPEESVVENPEHNDPNAPINIEYTSEYTPDGDLVPIPAVQDVAFKSAEDFVKADSGWFIRGLLPYFEDINEIHLTTILAFGVTNFNLYYEELGEEERERLFGNDAIMVGLAYSFYPYSNVDYPLKLILNPDFSIENYDYKNFNDYMIELGFQLLWDEETGRIVMYTGVFGGGPNRQTAILDSYEENGIHYVVTGSFWYDGYEWAEEFEDFDYMRENIEKYNSNTAWDLEYNIYAFKINQYGYVNIISKQPYIHIMEE